MLKFRRNIFDEGLPKLENNGKEKHAADKCDGGCVGFFGQRYTYKYVNFPSHGLLMTYTNEFFVYDMQTRKKQK